jgi:hypothetical protein
MSTTGVKTRPKSARTKAIVAEVFVAEVFVAEAFVTPGAVGGVAKPVRYEYSGA